MFRNFGLGDNNNRLSYRSNLTTEAFFRNLSLNQFVTKYKQLGEYYCTGSWGVTQT